MIRTTTISVTTTGNAGSAAGRAGANINGYINHINVNYHASAPATTDIDIHADPDGLDYAIYDDDDSATDVFISPRATLVNNAGAAITDSADRFAVNGALEVDIAGCDALTNAVVVTVIWDDNVPSARPNAAPTMPTVA